MIYILKILIIILIVRINMFWVSKDLVYIFIFENYLGFNGLYWYNLSYNHNIYSMWILSIIKRLNFFIYLYDKNLKLKFKRNIYTYVKLFNYFL